MCTTTKYSDPTLNTICTICAEARPWITTLIYKSTATPNAYYLAFEDLPMAAANWRMSTATLTGADGDFNDQVFVIDGVCHGGPCAGNAGSGGRSGGGSGGQPGGGSGGQPGSGTGGQPGSGGRSGDSGQVDSGVGGTGLANDGGSGGPQVCVPGQAILCACPDSRTGAQSCSADGQQYEACKCSSPASKSQGCGCGVPPGAGDAVIDLLGLVFVVGIGATRGRRRRTVQRQ